MGSDNAWALFGSDDDTDPDPVCSKRPRSDPSSGGNISGAAVGGSIDGGDKSDGTDTARFGAPKTSLYDDAYFAATRALWSDPEPELPTLRSFTDALTADALIRVSQIATALRQHRPEGGAAADALAETVRLAEGKDWSAVAKLAKKATDAHQRQLDHGNWPHECWQQSHVLALGFRIASRLHCTDENSETSAVPDRLGRIALEALAMVTLETEPSSVPKWLGHGILFAERKCVDDARLKQKRMSKENTFQTKKQNTAIPCKVPRDSPRIDTSRAVPRVSCDATSAASFHETYFKTNMPVVLEHLVCEKRGWAHLEEWRDVSGFFNDANDRLVPVTFGGHGDDNIVTEMALGDLIRDYLGQLEADEKSYEENRTTEQLPTVAYMSQHCLFHQVPELAKKIQVPGYLLGKLKPDTGAVNAWVGTADTKTALHRDPYSNLLTQTTGFKYVRLYDVSESSKLYPEKSLRDGNSNTFTKSSVVVETPDLKRHPKFADASYFETILAPGDALFMPKGMWHYVRALTPSVSVNFWWN